MSILGSFAGALLEGRDPARAKVLRRSTRVALPELEKWAERQTTPADTLVLEASGNAFAVAVRLRAMGRQVEILESHRAGKIGKEYCANDRGGRDQDRAHLSDPAFPPGLAARS